MMNKSQITWPQTISPLQPLSDGWKKTWVNKCATAVLQLTPFHPSRPKLTLCFFEWLNLGLDNFWNHQLWLSDCTSVLLFSANVRLHSYINRHVFSKRPHFLHHGSLLEGTYWFWPRGDCKVDVYWATWAEWRPGMLYCHCLSCHCIQYFRATMPF